MGKKLLFGLGALVAGASAAYVASKKLTNEQKDKLAMKVDETVLNGREKALQYNKYLQDFLEEKNVDGLKEKVLDRADEIKNEKAVQDALSSLKKATADIKDRLENTKDKFEDLADESTPEDWNDDIVIDGRSAFGEAKDNEGNTYERPTETFYPHNNQINEKGFETVTKN